MMQAGSKTRCMKLTVSVAISALALAGCSGGSEKSETPPTASTTNTGAAAPAAAPVATASAPAAAPAVDNVETLDGTQLASFTGDAAKGKTAFITCQTCHAVEAGVNKIGPSLHAVVGRTAGTIAGFSYSPANKNSGITWTPEKLFQYLEKPSRIVPGTRMIFPGIPEAQKRADVIAYLQSNS